jgi:NADPH:quinone reductase-like Zn-dependent oxidoreductase
LHDQAELGHTPDNVSDLQAATLGTGLITAGVALFRTLKFDLHDLLKEAAPTSKSERPWILIWGGAGITGIYLIQLARLLRFRIICAASPVNHEYVRALGAEVVLDRWTEPGELIEQIREATGDNVSGRGKQTAGKRFTDRYDAFRRYHLPSIM